MAIHNFPEGLATFTSAVADPELGVLVATAVALHNIPLGVSVAMPVYLATGSKWKALAMASVCGLTSIFGALIGYAVYEDGVSDYTNGVLFATVVGVMLWTALKELLPESRQHDRGDKYTTWLFFLGCLIMDLSLLVFEATGGHSHGEDHGEEAHGDEDHDDHDDHDDHARRLAQSLAARLLYKVF